MIPPKTGEKISDITATMAHLAPLTFSARKLIRIWLFLLQPHGFDVAAISDERAVHGEPAPLEPPLHHGGALERGLGAGEDELLQGVQHHPGWTVSQLREF